MKSHSAETNATPFQSATEHLQSLNEAFTRAAKQREALMEIGMKTWSSEVSRYLSELSEQSRATLEALGKCQGPLDLLAVEQQWLTGRAGACLDSGLRVAKAFADAAKSVSDTMQAPVH